MSSGPSQVTDALGQSFDLLFYWSNEKQRTSAIPTRLTAGVPADIERIRVGKYPGSDAVEKRRGWRNPFTCIDSLYL